jgi:hypothetical protein
LRGFDKESEFLVGKKCSKDFGDGFEILENLNLATEYDMNIESFDVDVDWVEILQSSFGHLEN